MKIIDNKDEAIKLFNQLGNTSSEIEIEVELYVRYNESDKKIHLAIKPANTSHTFEFLLPLETWIWKEIKVRCNEKEGLNNKLLKIFCNDCKIKKEVDKYCSIVKSKDLFELIPESIECSICGDLPKTLNFRCKKCQSILCSICAIDHCCST